ncbi:MAG: Y-family DNA polymerase [Legionellaceae bacterium]|jgi:DNA polymerase V|nr:Y-family DNA polymerase [Legionellaceae bacterium]
MFAIVDCNNFYASCERVFNPRLLNQPIIVLSNNDGCVIARSNEAKALDIKMGQPFFEIKRLCQTKGIHVFSSNYALYGDMSNRVMSVLEENWPEVDVYSIDEAFLNLDGLSESDMMAFCHQLHYKILRYTGIPVSIGVGKTKTLAKLANQIAKKDLKSPYFNITDEEHWLYQKHVSDVWGIGKQWSNKLMQRGFNTAGQLKDACPNYMKKQFNVTLAQVILELRGTSCVATHTHEAKKGIMSSRSFSTTEGEFTPIMQALASFCDVASTKLRKQGSVCGRVGIFIRTHAFGAKTKQYKAARSIKLAYPSSDVRLITHATRTLLEQLFKSGYAYKKVGVYLDEITPANQQQLDLWNEVPELSDTLMQTYDRINQRFGSSGIRIASSGFNQVEISKRQWRSPKYTTCWSDLPIVRL